MSAQAGHRADRAVIARVDQILHDFLQAQIASSADDDFTAVLEITARFILDGGKRLRPRFCYWGWRGAGGHGEAILPAAASLEMLHAFALIHDDIMDASDTRRGRPTVHRAISQLRERNGLANTADRFGINVAILAGDLCAFWSEEMLHGCDLPAARLAAARPLLSRLRTELCTGQYLDLDQQARQGTLEAALKIIRYKTARYTVQRPLQIGGLLAGAGPALLHTYDDYGSAIGEAFQLRDDVLGVFGDPATTGKSTLDDLRDGKATALIALARQNADPVQRSLIDTLHGNPDLDLDSATDLRHTIVQTGALDHIEAMIQKRAEAALTALDRSDVAHDAAAALHDLAVQATHRHA